MNKDEIQRAKLQHENENRRAIRQRKAQRRLVAATLKRFRQRIKDRKRQARLTEANKIPVFIAIDGEAVYSDYLARVCGKSKSLRYALLMVGDRYIVEHDPAKVLTLTDIFRFIWECFEEDRKRYKDRRFVYVGFSLGFDFTYWLRQLPEDRARMLLTEEGRAKRARKSKHPRPFPVRWTDARGQEWEFDILLKLNRFQFRPSGEPSWCTICDVIGFWQSSLLKAADPASWPNGVIDLSDYELVRRGKERRSVATEVDIEMIEYTKAENRLLSTLMTELAKALADLPQPIMLKASQWFGPGQVSGAWLRSIGSLKTADALEKIGADVLEIGRRAYYGGRFETLYLGHCGDIWEYDIASAYPYAISRLPDWTKGSWRTLYATDIEKVLEHAILHVEAKAPEHARLGPLPWRSPQGTIICYPLHVEGWYWAHEIRAAIRAGLIDRLRILEGIEFKAFGDFKPYRAIAELFEERSKCGKKTAKGKALKLVYNSAYGKLAQSLGNPKYAISVSASFITSFTRAQILDAIATHPDRDHAVVMIATDGIYFTSRHPALELGGQLGQWEESLKHNMTVFKPGFYWSDQGRTVMRTRGVSARDFIKMIDAADAYFSSNEPILDICIEVPRTFAFVTLRNALRRGLWRIAGDLDLEKVRLTTKDLANKRQIPTHYENLASGAVYLPPHLAREPLLSTSYEKNFGLDLENRDKIDNELRIALDFAGLCQ